MHVAKVFILCTATYHLHGTFLTKELIQDTFCAVYDHYSTRLIFKT